MSNQCSLLLFWGVCIEGTTIFVWDFLSVKKLLFSDVKLYLGNLIYFSCLQQNNNGLSRLILEKIKPSSSHSCLSGSSSYTQTHYTECCTPLVIYYFYCHKCSNFSYIIHTVYTRFDNYSNCFCKWVVVILRMSKTFLG